MDVSLRHRKKSRIEDDTLSQSSENFENDWDRLSKNSHTFKSIVKRKSHLRHFPNVPQEQVLKRYSCALASDFLRQGYLYVTDNYFAFYSNIFGYVTKLLIPVLSVEDITKEKTAKIIPNAIGIITGEQKHLFASFIQRENSYTFLRKIWQRAKNDLDNISDFESDSASPYSSEEEPLENDVTNNTDKLSSTHTKSKIHNFIWYSTILIIIILFIMSGVLLYRLMRVQNKYSSILASDESFERNPRVLKNFFQRNPDFYTKSYLSISEFVDKNIHVISTVRKSLQTLAKVLENENKLNK